MINDATCRLMRQILPVIVAGALVHPALAQTGSRKLTLTSGPTELGETIIVSPITEKLAPGVYHLTSRSQTDAGAIPVQVFEEDGVSYVAMILPSIPSKSSKTMTLMPALSAGAAEKSGVELVPKGPNVAINIDGKPFTEYRVDDGPKPFLYPLIGPTGEPFTRSFPMKKVEGEKTDHPHHRSLWFTFGNVNGIDFWAEPKSKLYGTIKETGRKPLIQGPVLARLSTTDDWIGPDGKKACEDERVLTVYHSGAERILDFDIKIKATVGPVVFNDTKEGMFGLRVASTMDVAKKGSEKSGGKIVTSEGLIDDKAWGKPASWVDFSGPVGDKTVGISILNHPESFRYPTTWHVRTYGLFAANPFGWHDFGKGESGTYTIPQGQEIRFRYRVILHAGDAGSAKLPEAFKAYAEPPRVNLVAE